MSNTPKRGNGHFSLAAAKAKVKGEPFVLDIDTENSIEIPRPSSDQMFEAEKAGRSGDSKGILRAVCGDVADEVLELFGPEDASVLQAFTVDVQKHFGLGE